MSADKLVCPDCGKELRFLSGELAHPDNLYCPDVIECGYEAWTRRIQNQRTQRENPSE